MTLFARALVAGCIVSFVFAASGSPALADPVPAYTRVAEGSTPTHRSQSDRATGDIYVYIGGAFPPGTHLATFQYLFDLTTEGNTTGYITPLLFQFAPGEECTVFTLVGIGRGFEVELKSAPQAIPFEIIEGIKAPTNAHFTFGFINALVDSSGSLVETSSGVIDFDNPSDGGEGVGGTGTLNGWGASSAASPVATLGTTFAVSGCTADEIFINPTRTYSAAATGIIAAQ